MALSAVALACLAFVPLQARAQSVRVTTSMGSFVIELNPQRAPLTVKNFLRYVNEGFYTNTLIHRVVTGFVVQGGGYSATDYKLKPTHESLVNESGNGLQNLRGTVGMARTSAPHSADAQFYINVADNPELDPIPTRWGYAVFGRVTEGMDVVDRIAVVPTGEMGPFKSEAPLKPIVIEKIELVTSDAAPPNGSGAAAANPEAMPSSGGEGKAASPEGATPPAGATAPDEGNATQSPTDANPPAEESGAPPQR